LNVVVGFIDENGRRRHAGNVTRAAQASRRPVKSRSRISIPDLESETQAQENQKLQPHSNDLELLVRYNKPLTGSL